MAMAWCGCFRKGRQSQGSSRGGIAGWSVSTSTLCIPWLRRSSKALRPFFWAVYRWVFCAKSWQLRDVHVAEKIARKGLELLGGFHQPLEHRSGRPRTPGLWHGCPGPQPSTPALARSVRPTGACHARACRASPESILYKRDSTTVATGHRWDGHSRGASPILASLDSHRPHGDKNASQYRSRAGVDWSAASERVALEAALSDGLPRVRRQHNGACVPDPRRVWARRRVGACPGWARVRLASNIT